MRGRGGEGTEDGDEGREEGWRDEGGVREGLNGGIRRAVDIGGRRS